MVSNTPAMFVPTSAHSPKSHAVSPNVKGTSGPRTLSVLGATGSIGLSTLDLVARNSDDFQVVALTAQTQVAELAALAIKHRAKLAVIGDAGRYTELVDCLGGSGIEAMAGEQALVEAASRPSLCNGGDCRCGRYASGIRSGPPRDARCVGQ